MATQHWIALTAAALLVFVSPCDLCAQDDAEADHDALRKIRAVAEEAINNNELELLLPYLADDFSIVTYTDREFTDFDTFKTRWEKTREELLQGGSYATDLQPQRSRILGDIAVARGNSANVLITGAGKRYEFPANWTAVLHKVDGEWKIVRAHSSLSPFDNPMLHDTVRGILLKAGGAALVGGIVIGGLAGWIVRGRRRSTVANTSSA